MMMKKLVIVWLLCCGLVSLEAQARGGASSQSAASAAENNRRAAGQLIFAAPISGAGVVDNEHITLLIESEVEAWNHFTHPTRGEADYVITGSTLPYVPRKEEAEFYKNYYILRLQLYSNRKQEVVVEQFALYDSFETLLEQFDQLMRNIFRNVINTSAPWTGNGVEDFDSPDETWRNKLLYAGAQIALAPRLKNRGNGDDAYEPSFALGVGLSLSWHFLRFMGVEIGGEAYLEKGAVSLTVPLSYKYLVLKPRNMANMMIDFSGGMEFNLPLMGDAVKPAPISLFSGIQPVLKLGSAGGLTVDTRLSYDLMWTKAKSDDIDDYRRWSLHVGVGYKYGFIQRQK